MTSARENRLGSRTESATYPSREIEMYSTTATVYRHSGRLGAAWILTPVVAAVAAPVLGVAYAYVDVYSPYVGYTSVIALGLFVTGLGLSVALSGRLAKCRNVTFLRVMGALAGFLGLYVAWVAFEYAVFMEFGEGLEVAPSELLLTPTLVWELAEAIAEDGWFSVRGHTPSGLVLWALWGGEALVAVVGAAYLGPALIADRVFCETCDRWAEPWKDSVRVAVPEEAERLEGLSCELIEVSESLRPAASHENPHVRVDVNRCRNCEGTATYRVIVVSLVANDKGDVEEKEQPLTDHLLADRHALARLESLAMRSLEASISSAASEKEEAG
jgi:hypothetical protein